MLLIPIGMLDQFFQQIQTRLNRKRKTNVKYTCTYLQKRLDKCDVVENDTQQLVFLDALVEKCGNGSFTNGPEKQPMQGLRAAKAHPALGTLSFPHLSLPAPRFNRSHE